MSSLTRRETLAAGAAALVAGATPRSVRAGESVEIAMVSRDLGAEVFFDPIGLFVPLGTRVVWRLVSGVHTATAYHPANGGRVLRIPEGAEPFDSGYLKTPGARFAITLEVAGVYDVCCRPHEAAGMVLRIVAGRAAGPGAGAFGAEPAGNREVPAAAQAAFPAVQRILAEGRIAGG